MNKIDVMKVTVIGLGLIGGSIALDLRKKKFATELIGVEANEIKQIIVIRFPQK